jgi:signal transduction histidine kinase/ligand-binding sensor domain-containing protein
VQFIQTIRFLFGAARFVTGLSKKLLICFCLALGVTAAKAQYRFDQWTTDTGLPQNSVYDMTQTRDGYLWLATADGLARFDGARFQVFSRSNSPGIANNRFISLFEDAQGDLWAGTEENGVTRIHAGRFESFAAVEGVTLGMVSRITGDAGGNAILGRVGPETFRFADGKFSNLQDGDSSETASEWRRGRSFKLLCRNAAEDQKIARCFVDGKLTEYSLHDTASVPDFLKVVQDDNGTVWLISSPDKRLFRVENQRPVPVDRATLPGEALRFVTGSGLYLISRDKRGALWLTDLSSMRSELFQRETAPEAVIVADGAHCAFRDEEGNFWFGSVKAGLFRARKQVVAALSKADGLAETNTYPIYQSRSGEIWVGTVNGLFTFQDGIFKPVEGPGSWVHAIGEDDQGQLLFSVWGILYIRKNGRTERFGPTEISSMGPINAIYTDREKSVWVGGTEGLIRFADGALTKFTTADGLAGNDVKIIIESKTGGLWIGTYGGLTRFENGQLKSWTEADGLPSRTIRSLYEDADGTLWIGSYDSGLARFKDGKFTRYDTRVGLHNDGVFQILEDDKRQFWISSNRGIYRVSKDELNEFADGKRAGISSIAYGKSDGMLNDECNGGRSPAGFKMRDGNLWFPTQDGVAIINPAAVTTNTQPPPVVIESVKIDNADADFEISDVAIGKEESQTSNPTSQIQIDPSQQNFEIQYTALSFINSENLRFKYRLEGLDSDWVDAGTRRTAYFSHVTPGEYTFRVIAANADGVWNTAGKSLRIVVLPPFYRTSWFAGLMIVVFGAIAFALYHRRVGKLESANRLQEEFSRRLINSNESERRRIAGELHDSIGQSLAMIKNRAVLSAESATDENLRRQLELITDQTTQTIGEVREISYALRPYLLDNLGLTKAVRSLLNKVAGTSGLAIQSELDDVDAIFDDDAEMSIYRIIQESLSNVLKHAEASTVQVFLKTSGRNLTVLVSDDGKGFDPNKAEITEADKGGFGLLGISERVKMLGGTQEIESPPGKGTTILIKIPIPLRKHE